MQTVPIEESGIIFAFDDIFIKYDECQYYDNYGKRLTNTKAVDFLVKRKISKDRSILCLIEVKNFENAGKERVERLKSDGDDPLHIEIAQKVRDSLAGLIAVGTLKNKECYRELEPYRDILITSKELQNDLVIVAFIEGNLSSYDKGHADGILGLERRIAKALKWLNCRVLVLNTDEVKKRNLEWIRASKK